MSESGFNFNPKVPSQVYTSISSAADTAIKGKFPQTTPAEHIFYIQITIAN